MSDPFAALLAKQAPASETSEEDSDPFNSLLKKGKPAGAPATPAAKAGEIPTDSPYTAPPKIEQDPSTLGKLARGKGMLETGADLGDIVVGGFPAMLLGTLGEVTQRASSLVDGRGYREGAKAGAQFSQAMGEKFGRPIFDNLVAAGLLDPKSRSVPMQAMDKIGGWLENAATIVEHDSKGTISKEDYLASVNGFMAAMGVKGVQVATAKALAKRGTANQKSAWDTALERFEAEAQLAEAEFYKTTPEKSAAGAAYDATGREVGAVKSLYGDNFAAEAAARRKAYEQRKAYEKGLHDFPPSGERTGSRDAVDLSLEGKETPTTYSGNQPFHTADTTAALKRGVVADTPIQTEGRLASVAATPLDSGLTKVRENRLFDMTMEERLAVKNSTKITDPKIITAAAVGATGLGLAMTYEPSAEEAAMAIGAGVLLRRGGVGESLRELIARPDAAPLGALLEGSAYTTSTIEKLADASPGQFKFKKAQVEQLLKREGVTKHERDLMMEALAQAPGDTITAKELMVGLKAAAQDFELIARKTDEHADFGVKNLSKKADDIATESHVYNLPIRTGGSSHFSDPGYFGHTRVFEADGIRHVVEVQSDLAQKAKSLPGGVDEVRPMLKDWHKRLIREELADAARNLEGSVRFATADTVAKVEGWPSLVEDPTAAKMVEIPGRMANPEHQGIYDRYSRDVEKFLRQLGAKPITDSAGHTWLEVPLGEQQKALPGGGARTQIGGADPKTLTALGAMGASAALAYWLTDPKRDREGKRSNTPKVRNALLAGASAAALSLFVLKRSANPGVARQATEILRGLEDFAGNTSYQIEKISPPVLRAVDKYKMGQLVRRQDYLHAATPFAELLRKASPVAGKALDAALLTGDWPTAIKALGDLGVRGAVAELGKVRELLADVGKDLLSSTAVRGLVDNYYPRVVSDLDGLLGALGKPAREFLEEAVEQAARKAGRPLDNIEVSQVVNKALENSLFKRGGDNKGFRAGRTIPEVTADLAKFYAPASESLVMYLDWAANAIERAKFFGKHAERDAVTGKLDLDHSIGNVLYDLDKKQALSRVDSVELRRLLGVEFTYAQQAGSGFLQSVNRLTSAALIANAGSALMNLGDLGQAVNMYGLTAAVQAIKQTLGRGDGRVTRQMMGLADTIANEFTGADKAPIIVNVPGYGGVRLSTAKFLDSSLKWSGFQAMDSFGKQVMSNAAVKAARAQVATPTGLAKFTKSYAAYFGADLPKLVDDLKSGKITPFTLEYVWRKVNDAQPLTSIDMPTARTANPNFRFMWSLKSYMIKQLTLMRKEGLDKLRRGDPDGAKFLLRYALIVGSAQAGMEWIVNSLWGKDDELTWGDIPMNAFRNFGISQHAVEQFRKGRPVEGASAMVAPPILVLTEVLSGNPEAVSRIPVVGKPTYMHLLGGAEKANKKAEAKKRAEERKREGGY